MKQRLIRVLVYEGSPERIQQCLQDRQVKGSMNFCGKDGWSIREAIIGDFLETIIPFEESPHG